MAFAVPRSLEHKSSHLLSLLKCFKWISQCREYSCLTLHWVIEIRDLAVQSNVQVLLVVNPFSPSACFKSLSQKTNVKKKNSDKVRLQQAMQKSKGFQMHLNQRWKYLFQIK